jgi:hypothetical protein
MYNSVADLDFPFFLGSGIIILYQMANFNEIKLSDPAYDKFLHGLGPLRTRDVSGRAAYGLCLFVFLAVNLAAYYALCRVSPEILTAITKIFIPQKQINSLEIPYALYIAAIFVGLTQPMVPVFSHFVDFVRDSFQASISVPRRIVDNTNDFTSSIISRTIDDRQSFEREISRITNTAKFGAYARFIDITYFNTHIESLEIDYNLLSDRSQRELDRIVEKVILIMTIAAMRKSGSVGLRKTAEFLQADTHPAEFSLVYFVASILTFSVGVAVLWHLLVALDGPVAALLHTNITTDWWHSDDGDMGVALAQMVVPMIVASLTSVYLWSTGRWLERPDVADVENYRVELEGARIAEDLRRFAPILALSIATSFGAILLGVLYTWGLNAIPSDLSAETMVRRLVYMALQTFVSLPISFLMVQRLERMRYGVASIPFLRSLLLMCIGTSLFAALYGEAFRRLVMHQFPNDAPAWETVLLAIIASGLAALWCRISIDIFFSGPKTASVLQRLPEPQRHAASPTRH